MKSFTKCVLIGIAVIFCAVLALKGSALLISSGTWQATGNLSSARAGASAALLQDGRILITGGNSGSGTGAGPQASADLFNTDGTISPASPMTNARSGHISVTLQNGKVLVAGGITAGGSATSTSEVFDPIANSWTPMGLGMIEARSGATAALLSDGRVLIAGGQNGSTISSTIEIFNPALGAFTSAGMMSSPRTQHAITVLQDGRVLIVGGNNGTAPVASTDIFDPVAGAVSAGPILNTARFGHSATTLLNGLVVVIGGNNGNANPAQVDATPAEIIDFTAATPAFTTLATNLATPREGHLAVLLPNNNNILIIGGTSAGTTIASAELFTPQESPQGVWTYGSGATGTMTAARSSAAGSANQVNAPSSTMQRNGVVMVAGGNDANGNTLNTTEAYGYATVQTDQSDYPPGTTVTITGSGFKALETVTIQLVESPLIDTHGPFTVQADANGNFADTSFVTDTHDLDVHFYLIATGGTSGFQAQNSFTDSKNVTVTFAGSGSGLVTGKDNTTNVNGIFNCTDSGGTASGTCTFSAGNTDQLTLTATPTSPSTIGAWTVPSGYTIATGTCGNGNTTCTFTVDNAAGTVTVAFNPGPATKLAITSVNGGANPTAGTGFSVVVQAQDSSGNPSNAVLSTGVGLSRNTGTGTLGGTLTGTIAAGTNSVTISGVTYTKAESGVVLTATRTSGDTLTAGNSAPFTVNPGAATKLVYTAVPSTGTAGTAFSVSVQSQDANGNPASPTSNTTITLSKATGGGTLDGTLTGTISTSANSVTISTLVYSKADTMTLPAAATAGETTLTAVTSGNIVFSAGAATKLAYTAVPSTGTAGIAFSVTVQSQDANGNPASPTSNTTITLSKATGGGTLSGTLTGTISTSANSVTISTPVYSSADTMTLTATATAGETTLTAVTSGNIVFSAGTATH